MPAPRISAFVISFNRANILGTCLRGLAFADELIVVDKSSTDGSRAIAEALADTVLTVPWTPTVEETRTLALSLCRHEWILFMDDDECLCPGAEQRIRAEIADPRGDIYAFPLRNYILGKHDERAYYWPENHVRLFRRGAVTFSATVHAGLICHSARSVTLSPDDGVCLHHFSHADVTGWIEKANRYTSRRDRAGIMVGPEGFSNFAHERIDHWMLRTEDIAPDGYPAAVALLRAVYDMIDALKTWEAEAGLDGHALFKRGCEALDAAYEDQSRHLHRPAKSRHTTEAISMAGDWSQATPEAGRIAAYPGFE
jgi:glycosyltransferase involved in cell wall biosynthesis